jgi:lipid II:glycine glycyltransferase (peptidoglycan interpeptide bridge formation enzyme)
MEIKIIKNKEEWNGWIFTHASSHHFTQSWLWGDILIAEGKIVDRLAVVEKERVVAQAQVVYSSIFFGWQYAFCPKGPVVGTLEDKNLELKVYETLVRFLNRKNIIFFRCEPSLEIKHRGINSVRTIDSNPSATLLLNLNKTGDQLRAQMHPKTRYNISLAQKKDLKISQEKNIEVFWHLMNKTGSRDNFSLHHKAHYEKVLTAPDVFQLTAYYGKTPVACAVFIGFGNTFTYLYGASDYEFRNLMAPYLLQWEGMEIGNDFGSTWYDFFGVAPRINEGQEYVYDLKHQYAGVTRFKLGFGGVAHQDPGTYDVVVRPFKYVIYQFVRKLRRLL